MDHKLNKFLISLSGVALMLSGVMGLKFQKETEDIKKLKESLRASLISADKVRDMIDVQDRMEAARMENLKKADNAQVTSKKETKVQTVVIPGKTVKQTTTSSSGSTSSKTTKTS